MGYPLPPPAPGPSSPSCSGQLEQVERDTLDEHEERIYLRVKFWSPSMSSSPFILKNCNL